MKLRIKDNSIRFRLTQSEVRQLREEKQLFASTGFGSGHFSYGIRASKEEQIDAQLSESGILALVPEDILEQWASTDQVSLVAERSNTTPAVLIEKDFKCLTVRLGEDESDHFPNPAESHSQAH